MGARLGMGVEWGGMGAWLGIGVEWGGVGVGSTLQIFRDAVKPVVVAALLASLPARSCPFTRSCPGQYIQMFNARAVYRRGVMTVERRVIG